MCELIDGRLGKQTAELSAFGILINLPKNYEEGKRVRGCKVKGFERQRHSQLGW